MPEVNLLQFFVLFLVAAVTVGIPVLLVVMVVRFMHLGRDDSQGILRRRFARGEISQAEFEEAKRILGS